MPGLPQLAHPLVSLRPLAAADLEPWYAYLHLPQVHEHTSWDIAGPDALRSHVGTRPGDVNATSWRLAIAWRDGGALAGTVGLNEVSRVHRSAEIAYDLAPDAWGRGIARATCTAVVAWAHERAGLARIQATVMTSNQRSLRVLEHCGFQHEGLMRAYRHFRGRSGDFHRFAHVTPMTAD
nr:GNAT family protein [Sphaerotilus mobilis]